MDDARKGDWWRATVFRGERRELCIVSRTEVHLLFLVSSPLKFSTAQARADYVDLRLAELYPATSVPLNHRDPYTLLVAVLLSAQCTDKRVNLVTPGLWALADNPADMATEPVAKIQSIIRPCGLSPQKARAISELSRLLMERHAGQVPRTFAELEELPGVGHKTASVVMSQAWGQPAFPVDTHIHRLAQRWKLTKGQNVVQTETDLKRLFPREHWNQLHLRIIFYGREHCTARGCEGTNCEICRTLNPMSKAPAKTGGRLRTRTADPLRVKQVL